MVILKQIIFLKEYSRKKTFFKRFIVEFRKLGKSDSIGIYRTIFILLYVTDCLSPPVFGLKYYCMTKYLKVSLSVDLTIFLADPGKARDCSTNSFAIH